MEMCVGEMRAAEGGLQVCAVKEASCQGGLQVSETGSLARVRHTHPPTTPSLHLLAFTHRDAGPESEGTGLRDWAQSCNQRPRGPPRSVAGSTDIMLPR